MLGDRLLSYKASVTGEDFDWTELVSLGWNESSIAGGEEELLKQHGMDAPIYAHGTICDVERMQQAESLYSLASPCTST